MPMQDPIRLTFAARNGEVEVTLKYLANPNTYYSHFLEPAAAGFSAERLRRAADGQAPAADPEWDVYLLARIMNEEDSPDWVQVDLIDRSVEAHGAEHRGGIEPDDARAAANALEAAADGAGGP